jgi:hypothetical protein
MSSAWQTVRAALVTTADNALSIRVSDGFDLSSDPGDVLMIAVPNLSDVNSITAGSFSQAMATMGSTRTRDEDGSINGVVMARNGQGDQALATSTAFGYIASLEAALRSDPSLGITSYVYLEAWMTSGDVLEDQIDGATTAISFTVTYKARL